MSLDNDYHTLLKEQRIEWNDALVSFSNMEINLDQLCGIFEKVELSLPPNFILVSHGFGKTVFVNFWPIYIAIYLALGKIYEAKFVYHRIPEYMKSTGDSVNCLWIITNHLLGSDHTNALLYFRSLSKDIFSCPYTSQIIQRTMRSIRSRKFALMIQLYEQCHLSEYERSLAWSGQGLLDALANASMVVDVEGFVSRSPRKTSTLHKQGMTSYMINSFNMLDQVSDHMARIDRPVPHVDLI